MTRYIPEQMQARYLSDFSGSPDPTAPAPAFASYPLDTPLSSLPAPDHSADLAFIEGFRNRQALQTQPNSCWLTSSPARVTNVNEYVNLRREPGFSARVVRRVPLGEQVQVTSSNPRGFGSARAIQNCQNACQALDRNLGDPAALARARQCIDDNVIWYEVTDARGNRGWISRRFLQQEG